MLEAKRRRDAVLIREYLDLTAKANEHRARHDCSDAALVVTTELLERNPENYTVWNIRREILSGIFSAATATPETKKKLLVGDLVFLGRLLKRFPKTYWLWNHRIWCLEQDPSADWGQELALVNYMLEKDARNFQCWHYRRYVVKMQERASGEPATASEFKYTTAKINANFSNYSAWHNRSKLVPLYTAEFDNTQRRKFLDSEFEYVTQAIFTDPDDHSAWLYHSWLVEVPEATVPDLTQDEVATLRRREVESLASLYEEEPESKNIMFFLARCLQLAHMPSVDVAGQPVSPLDLLQNLQTVDPDRKNMYIYFAQHVKK